MKKPIKKAVKKPVENKLIKMTRNGKQVDVHPDEVKNYARAGYYK